MYLAWAAVVENEHTTTGSTRFRFRVLGIRV